MAFFDVLDQVTLQRPARSPASAQAMPKPAKAGKRRLTRAAVSLSIFDPPVLKSHRSITGRPMISPTGSQAQPVLGPKKEKDQLALAQYVDKLLCARPDPDDSGGLGAEESGIERTGPTQWILLAILRGSRLAEVGRYYDSANDPVTARFSPDIFGSLVLRELRVAGSCRRPCYGPCGGGQSAQSCRSNDRRSAMSLISEEADPSEARAAARVAAAGTWPNRVTFSRHELNRILNLYGRMVADGEWRDYAIDFLRDRAVFSIFRRASEVPIYRIEKDPRLTRKQGIYSVISASGLILRRGHELDRVLLVIDRKPALV